MYKSTYLPFLFLFFLFFPFTSFSLSLFISFPLGIQKKNPSPIEAVSLFGNFMNPQLYRCHLLSIRSKRSCVASSATPVKTSLPPALPLSPAFHSSGNKTRQNAARRCHQQYRSRHHESPALSLSSAFLLSYL